MTILVGAMLNTVPISSFIKEEGHTICIVYEWLSIIIVRFVHLFWRWRLLNRVKRSNQIFNLMQYLIPMEQVSQIWTLCSASCGRPTTSQHVSNHCGRSTRSQCVSNCCDRSTKSILFFGPIVWNLHYQVQIYKGKPTFPPLWHSPHPKFDTNHFTVATGDALKGVISGWYLSTVRERTLAKNLMLIAIANLGLQQSAAVGLSKQKDWEIDWRNKIWTAEYRVQICIHKFPQQSDFISFAISYTSWISTCKLIKLSASKNLSPINFSSYWIYKQ